MTVYLDAIWLLNFLLDLLLLMLTKTLANEETKKKRLLFGAFIASLIVPISLYFPNAFFSTVIGKFFYSIIIILCTFRFKTIYRMVHLLLLFYFLTFAMGGGLLATHYLFNHPIILSNGKILTFQSGYGDPISWIFLMIGFPMVWLFTKTRMDKHSIEKIRYDQLYPVTLTMNGMTYSTTGYIDSGNQLTDPLTKAPVIIGDEVFLKNWFSESEWSLLKKAHENLELNHIPDKWKNKIRLVPFQGVEGINSFLLTLKPEEVIVEYEQRTIRTNKVLLGIQFASLTKDHRYHCLLQPQLIKMGTVDIA